MQLSFLSCTLCSLLFVAGFAGPLGAQAPKRPLLKEGAWTEDVITSTEARDVVWGTPCKEYEIECQADETYVFDMESRCAHFDSYLRLKDSEGRQWASDDDGGQGFNARIVFKCSRPGKYIVVATSFAADAGRFALIMRRPLEVNGNGHTQTDAFPATGLQRVRGLKRVERPFRTYPLALKAGTTYHVKVTAEDSKTKPVLLLRSIENWVRDRNDNRKELQRATLDYRSTESQIIFLVVTTTEPEGMGNFYIRISEVGKR